MWPAVLDARRSAAGHEAVVVSHQLPIWVTRLKAEGRRFLHDPRKRNCTLCSLTSFTFDGRAAGQRRLLRACRRPDPGRRPQRPVLRRRRGPRRTGPRPEVGAPIRSLLAVLLVGAVSAGCGGTADTGDKGYVWAAGIITRLPADERREPGEVSGETLDGEDLSLDEYAGQVVVLNVWGSWCPPCRKEAPTLAAAARELADDDVVFVGVNTKDASPEQGLAFERRYDVPYESLFDPSGRTLLAFRGTLNPSAIPSTVVLDKQGRVAASILGEVPSRRTLVDLVRDVRDSERPMTAGPR